MRIRFLAILICFSLIPNPIFADTSSLSGKTCSKLGDKKISKGFSYTCLKSKNKLIWSKPIKVLIPTKASPNAAPSIQAPTPSPSASAPIKFIDAINSESGKPCKKINEESFPLSGALRCVGNIWLVIPFDQDSVASRAFRSLVEKYNKNLSGNVNIKFFEDPSSGASPVLLRRSMEAGARLWNVSDLPKQPYPVLIGHSLAWLKSTAEANNLIPNNGWTNIENQFKECKGCSYAEFYSVTGQPWYVFCYSDDAETINKDFGFLQVGAHEYTHVIQFHLSNNFNRNHGDSLSPWLQEGYATYVGMMLGASTQVDNALRAQLLDELLGVKTPLSDYKYRFPAKWNDVYPLGGFATEAIVAVKGIDSMEKILSSLAKGNKIEEAIVDGTGKSLDFWTEIGQGYVDSLIKGKPWTLEELKSKF